MKKTCDKESPTHLVTLAMLQTMERSFQEKIIDKCLEHEGRRFEHDLK